MSARLLVVDDDPAVLRWFERTFGARVDLVPVADKARALRVLATRARLHGVIADMDLGADGRWAGLEVLRAAATQHPDARLFGWTGHAPDSALLMGLAVISAGCIIKGLDDVAALESAIAAAERVRSVLPISIVPPGPDEDPERGMMDIPAAHARIRRYVADLGRQTPLSQAQLAALELCLLGYSREEAASWMGVAVSTYDNHMKRVRKVFGVRSNRDLFAKLHLLEKSADLRARGRPRLVPPHDRLPV